MGTVAWRGTASTPRWCSTSEPRAGDEKCVVHHCVPRRHSAARASTPVQNHRSPVEMPIRVLEYDCPPGTWLMRVHLRLTHRVRQHLAELLRAAPESRSTGRQRDVGTNSTREITALDDSRSCRGLAANRTARPTTGSAGDIRVVIGLARGAGLHDMGINPPVQVRAEIENSVAESNESRSLPVAPPLCQCARRGDQPQSGITRTIVAVVFEAPHTISPVLIAQTPL